MDPCQTIYKAAKDKLAGNYITDERVMAIDEPLARLFKARTTFLFGDKSAGQQVLDELMAAKPKFPEAQLLQADFFARTGDVELARQSLTEVRANPQAPGWVLSEANVIEGTLP
jgi:hypothetical protein